MAAVLEAMQTGILVVAPDWRILYANGAAARRLGLPVSEFAGADLRSVCPSLAAEREGDGAPATLSDGRPRCFHADVSSGARAVGVEARVCRDHAARLVFELSPGADDLPAELPLGADERAEENAALRILARQMAAVADSRQLLTVLCEAAWAQCGGFGACVVEVEDDHGRVAVGVGALVAIEGRHFPLEGSFSGEAIDGGGVTLAGDVAQSRSALGPTLRAIGVGPMMVGPLIAHGDVLGVLVVVRHAGDAAFAARELQRLQVIADHASLAVWKEQLLERAQAADSAKGRFLATMSHEFRTPLTALTGYGELLADQVLGPLSETQLDVLERMRSVTHHLSTMIEDVLSYSSLETGAETVRPTEFLAADLVHAVAAVVEPIARQKGLALECAPTPETLRLHGDVDKIRQILVNLVGNAVKFTDEGEVRVGARADGDEVRFAVEDTGVGIAEGDMPRLFRPFTQLDTGLTRRHGGTGLGLYISGRLAALVGGRIEVRSVLGAGSTFELVVPQTSGDGR